MRTTKLTLSADRGLIRQAKKLAEAKGTSLSSMVSRYLSAVLRGGRGDPEPGPITRKATGLVRLPPGRSDRDLLAAALSERHGPRK